jgi:hypothetical protein
MFRSYFFSVDKLRLGFKWFKIFYKKRKAIIVSMVSQEVMQDQFNYI